MTDPNATTRKIESDPALVTTLRQIVKHDNTGWIITVLVCSLLAFAGGLVAGVVIGTRVASNAHQISEGH